MHRAHTILRFPRFSVAGGLSNFDWILLSANQTQLLALQERISQKCQRKSEHSSRRSRRIIYNYFVVPLISILVPCTTSDYPDYISNQTLAFTRKPLLGHLISLYNVPEIQFVATRYFSLTLCEYVKCITWISTSLLHIWMFMYALNWVGRLVYLELKLASRGTMFVATSENFVKLL